LLDVWCNSFWWIQPSSDDHWTLRARRVRVAGREATIVWQADTLTMHGCSLCDVSSQKVEYSNTFARVYIFSLIVTFQSCSAELVRGGSCPPLSSTSCAAFGPGGRRAAPSGATAASAATLPRSHGAHFHTCKGITRAVVLCFYQREVGYAVFLILQFFYERCMVVGNGWPTTARFSSRRF